MKRSRMCRCDCGNVLTGRIEATTSANQNGAFAFQNVDGGTHVIELVGAGGALSALGSQFTISSW